MCYFSLENRAFLTFHIYLASECCNIHIFKVFFFIFILKNIKNTLAVPNYGGFTHAASKFIFASYLGPLRRILLLKDYSLYTFLPYFFYKFPTRFMKNSISNHAMITLKPQWKPPFENFPNIHNVNTH